MVQSISMQKGGQKSFIGDALGDAGAWLGRKAGQAVGGLLGLKKGGKVHRRARSESPPKMKRGGRAKAPHMVKGSKAAKAHMAKLRTMRK